MRSSILQARLPGYLPPKALDIPLNSCLKIRNQESLEFISPCENHGVVLQVVLSRMTTEMPKLWSGTKALENKLGQA